ncbi:MAG: hypothetical protein R2844_08870 [Caldilineales bacterium]
MKIWLEELPEEAEEADEATWRGHITHVPSGRRRYFEQLQDVVGFIRTYLETLTAQ